VISYRPATQADVVAFFGELPDETITAVAVLVDDEPACLIGMARDGNSCRVFSDYKPALEPYLAAKNLTLLRALKAAQKQWSETRMPVYTLQERGPEILIRLGFRRIDEGVYLWQP
jgi:hypothetical protein